MSNEETPSFGAAVAAISAGDLEALRDLLDEQPDLVHQRSSSPKCATLLHYTAFNGSERLAHAAPVATPSLARLLLERGALADAVAFGASAATALSWNLSSWLTYQPGIQNSLSDVYLDGGAAIDGVDGDGAPMGHAIGFGYTRAVEHLAARGASVDYLTAAAALGDLDRLNSWHVGDGRFAPSAMNFTRSEQLETGRFSWPPPRDPDPGALALITAATHGRNELVQWLLGVGVDPNVTVTRGQTPLHFAAYIGHPAVVATLLDAGANPDACESQFNRSPAEWAEETGEGLLAQLIRARIR